MILYESIGTLDYSRGQNGGFRLVLNIDPEISRYYKSLIPKYIHTNPQLYLAHISVVRKEIPPNTQVWSKYQGESCVYTYSPIIHTDGVYFWLNCFSTRLEKIRLDLGLPVHSIYTDPPKGFFESFSYHHCQCKIITIYLKQFLKILKIWNYV